MPNDQPRSLKLAVSGVFFVGYLLIQTIYPMVPWVLGGDRAFTWRMFAGYDDDSQFTVVNEDGTRRLLGNALRSGTALRILGPEVDQRRFLPPWLCAHWSGAQSVIVRDRVTQQEDVTPCRSSAR